ncbi:MAG TPA: VOC family protein [Candidatus Binataceae bacterium]|jgi:glyoxylase I family protein|nr:VOC family protein [Candidatus Binataceae bacterium]
MERPFQIAELDHVVVRCLDQSAMLDFYTRVLGLREERRVEGLGLIQLRAGASMIDLVPGRRGSDHDSLNVDHFCLGITVSAWDAAIAYLEERHIPVASQPVARYGARGTGLSIYINDPEGNVIELKQMPNGAGCG